MVKAIERFLKKIQWRDREEAASIYSDRLTSAWKLFVSVPPGGRVLILENALSYDRIDVAELKGFVVKIGTGYENAYFIKEKAKFAGTKVETCVTDRIDLLPFSDGSFDLIAVCEIEQIGRMLPYSCSNWQLIEKTILKLNRLLKPDGTMYIDSASASIKMLRDTGRIGIPSWLINRKLSKQGIRLDRVLYLYPSNERSIEAEDEVLGLQQAERFKNRINAYIKSERMGYIFSRMDSIKQDDSIIQNLTNKLKENKKIKDFTFKRLTAGSAGIYVMDLGECIVRIPTTNLPLSMHRWRNNYEALLSLKDVVLPFGVPEPIFLEEAYRQPFSVETKLQGINAEDSMKKRRKGASHGSHAIEILIALYRATGKSFRLASEDFDRIIGHPIDLLIPCLTKGGADCLTRIRQKFSDVFLGQEVQLVRTHGDFKTNNFIVGKDGQINGVFDWDLSVEYGLPLLDLFLFIGFAESERREASVPDVILEDFIRKDGMDYEIVGKYLGAIGEIDGDIIKCLALLCIIYYFVFHLKPSWCKLEVNRKKVERVLFAARESEFFGKARSFSTTVHTAHAI